MIQTRRPRESVPQWQSLPNALLWDDWHVVAEVETLRHFGRLTTTLFDLPLHVVETPQGVRVSFADGSGAVPARVRYGLIWTCLGDPVRDIIAFPESFESDRYVASTGSLGIWTSGLRLVENFLDLAHLPFVHAGLLGAEPYTEVPPYKVTVSDDDEIWVTECRSYQPVASPAATEEFDVDYTYRVARPYTVVLYKTNPLQRHRRDCVAMMVQPVSEERCVAHMLALYLNEGDPNQSARWFERLITSQDKPILENQRPRRLPLDPRAELPVRADAAATAYRRWLSERGITYGAIPARVSLTAQ